MEALMAEIQERDELFDNRKINISDASNDKLAVAEGSAGIHEGDIQSASNEVKDSLDVHEDEDAHEQQSSDGDHRYPASSDNAISTQSKRNARSNVKAVSGNGEEP